MTAQTVEISGNKKGYFHIYNKGVDNRDLFKDDQDHEVFLGYLKNYLSSPLDPKELKKTFSVNGRTFKGVPHQPKNFFNKVELIAYNLMPNHFHLVVKEISQGSLAKLTRSLSTRYAIYYNKKYQRRGSLCAGPYKSVQIKDVSQLLYLTRYLHRESFKEKKGVKDLSPSGYSSYEEYLGERVTSWIKPKVVLSYFDKSENDHFKGIDDYKNFIESYVLKQEEKKMLKDIVIESKPEHFEKTVPKIEESTPPKEVYAKPVPEPRSKIPEFIATSTIAFILLFGIGFRNVLISSANTPEFLTPDPQVSGIETSEPLQPPPSPILPSPTPQVPEEIDTVKEIEDLITEDIITEPSQAGLHPEGAQAPVGDSTSGPVAGSETGPEAKTMIVITITDGSDSVNIRQQPSINSEKIGTAKHGETFEFVSEDSGWYQFKLDDGSIAFVSARYAEMKGTE
jgi:putative transposase